MKFEIDPKVFAKALANGLDTPRSTLPIMEHCLIEAGPGDRISITTCDHSAQRVIHVEAQVQDPGKATCLAGALKKIVPSMTKTVKVEHSGEEGSQLIVRHGRGVYKLDSLPPGEYPLVNAEEGASALEVDANELATAIKTVMYAASKKDVRYYLQGIALIGDKVQATDGHRLGIASIQADIPEIVIPIDNSRGVIEALEQGDVTVVRGPSYLLAKGSSIEHTTKLIDCKYPDTSRSFMHNNKSPEAVFEPGEMIPVLKRIQVMQEKVTYPAVTFHAEDGCLALKARHVDCEDTVSAEISGDWPDGVAINPQYLIDMLQQISGKCRWLAPGVVSPQSFMPQGDESALHIIQCIRL